MKEEIEINIPFEKPLDEKIFHTIKGSLLNKKGMSYSAFKKTLQPDYSRIWIEIAIGWVSLLLVFVVSFYSFKSIVPIWPKIIIAFSAAAIAGFTVSYIINFFHEAAHFNIAKQKETNDLLANFFLGILQAQGIKHYRIIHWQHHVHHGTTADTERSYFEALTVKFFLETLTGIRALKIILYRNKNIADVSSQKDTETAIMEGKYMLLAGTFFHISIIALLGYTEQYWMLLTWILAFGTFFPFFSSLRQLLEHRSEMADKQIDYSKVNHGRINRIFYSGLFASGLGSAGFTRHLLHHLEPQVSYTNLKQLEEFLTGTSIGPFLQKQKTYLSYLYQAEELLQSIYLHLQQFLYLQLVNNT
jgi:fatty acid desaturase